MYICAYTRARTHTHPHTPTHVCVCIYIPRVLAGPCTRTDKECALPNPQGKTHIPTQLTPARTRKGDSAFSGDNPCVRTRAHPHGRCRLTYICAYINGYRCIQKHIQICYGGLHVDLSICSSVCRMHRSFDTSVWAFVHIRTYIYCVPIIHISVYI